MTTPRYLIDSDVCIKAMRRDNESPMRTIRSMAPEGLAISVITYGEVLEGILGTPDPVRNRQRWDEFLAPFYILDVTYPIVEIWGDLRRRLRRKGEGLADADTLIGATALYFDMTVVTGNLKHFGRIPGLDIVTPE